MRRLPPYHVTRPRLTSRCRHEHVVVVEAGSGFGKSVLAAELVDAWRAVGIDVVLLSDGVTPNLLAARLRSAIATAGFSEAADAMGAAGDDAQGAVEFALSALANEACAIVIDDAHHADREAAALVEYLAALVQGEQRLVVLARRLPDGAERLRRAEYAYLGAEELRLVPEETLRLCRSGFGLDVGPQDASAVDEATGGWTAAAVLAAARAKRTGEDLSTLAGSAGGQGPGVVAAMLEAPIAALGAGEADWLAQVGRLPFFDGEVLDRAVGSEGYFDRLLQAGMPITKSEGPWWEMPGPVRDHLTARAPADLRILGRAAAEYEQRRELSAALELLASSGYDMAAAEMLAQAPPAVVDSIDALELSGVVRRLSENARRAHPIVLLHLARNFNAATLMHQREAALQEVEAVVAPDGDPELRRMIATERAKDLVRNGSFDEASDLARSLLEETSPDELLTRAGLYSVLGRAVCWRFDDEGRRDVAALIEADAHLARAMDIYGRLQMRAAAAVLVLYRAIWIAFARGQAASALDRLNEGLELAVDQPRVAALLRLQTADVELELGHFAEAEASLAEVMRAGERFNDEALKAYAYWEGAILASCQGDLAATIESLRLVEGHRGEWWEFASAEFLASAADCLGRVGEGGLAAELLGRAKENPQDAGPVIAMSEAVLLARFGDPQLAEERLLAAPGQGIDPREYWRVTLFRALAAWRRGEPEAGALAARAFEEAAALGLPHVPLTRERVASETLIGLAVETGQPASLALQVSALPTAIFVLGPLRVTSGGRELVLAPGRGRQLLKLLAASGGRVVSEQAIDALWTEADPDAGRHRLRTVLNRLKSEIGDVVLRDGEMLVLRPDVSVDLAEFEADARRALALGRGEPMLSVARARTAIARYRGDLLPDDPYEEWAARPRERARRTMLQLLDLCADVAAARGDLDEMRRVVELTIDLAPYDDERYLRAASLLLQQGRRGAALTVVRRARSSLAEIGLQPPLHLLRLEEEITA